MTRGEQYLANIGNKFEEDGSVRYFPGNTIISFIDHKAPVFAMFCKVRQMLRESSAGECFAFMPDDSIHMTVFEGVCDQWREASVWTNLLALDAPLEDVDKLFEEKFKHAPKLGSVRMHAVGIKADGGYGVALRPCTQADEDKLRDYRSAMSELLGIRFPNHDSYRYHISICYGIKVPTAQQEKALDRYEEEASAFIAAQNMEFDVVEPDMTYFKNMFAFEKKRFERPNTP